MIDDFDLRCTRGNFPWIRLVVSTYFLLVPRQEGLALVFQGKSDASIGLALGLGFDLGSRQLQSRSPV
jgi:hypothetical protein